MKKRAITVPVITAGLDKSQGNELLSIYLHSLILVVVGPTFCGISKKYRYIEANKVLHKMLHCSLINMPKHVEMVLL